MASSNHLDATSGREVVYCHNCKHEWYHDERPNTLECPSCHSEVTEIVSVDNDPRDMHDDESQPDLEQRRREFLRHFPLDSDEEFDDDGFEEHTTHGPHGFFSHRAIYRSPDPPGPGNGPRESDQVIRRFTELLGDLGGPTVVGRSGRETLYANPPRVTHHRFSGPGFSGGVSSFTISTGPARVPHDAYHGPMGDREDPFQRAFGNIMGEMVPPPIARAMPPNQNGENGGDGNTRQADFTMAFSQLIASLINPHMVHGDAVYSQEALDRIITNLMEANPQSNAPPPASEETIANLPKKNLDEVMLGPELKGECTICIDDMKIGDEVVVLPCKHWFHEQCVVLWLKQHNTCPICRAPIDGEAAGRPGGAAPTSNARSGPSGMSSRFRRPTPPTRMRSDPAGPSSQQQSFRRDSNSPPMYSGSPRPSRVRSPSPSSRHSAQSERARDGRGSSSGGPLHWIRDQFRGDRRS
ncbi:hypothetical protein F4776DRAFT_114927 [Hypoxylon sp. NC0597]|nr:hypothetical protein F4776DRAFT_114927 [Hypoxylon sp. NC0597]